MTGSPAATARSEGTRRRAPLTVVSTVVFGLVITAFVTLSTAQRVNERAATETNNRMAAIGDALERQVSRYAEVLYGLRANWARDPGLSRQDFHQLVELDALTQRNPGAESVTFDRLVPTRSLDAFERRTREEVPGFTVHPRTKADLHVVVDYVEPRTPRSPALGLDIAAEPARKSALLFARDSGELSATEPISLIQAPESPGFLLMLAAYDVSPVPLTAPARSRHFLGVLVAVFAAEEMVPQAIGAESELDVSIYDAGPTVNTPRARARPVDWLSGEPVPDYTNYADIDVASRRWRLVTDSPVRASITAPLAAAITGTALTLLVAGALAAMSLSRRRAVRLADQMTQDLRISEERLRAANESMRGFVDVAAHDLRSPLTAISGFSQLLQGDGLPEETRRTALAAIARQSAHMSQLIDDLLTLSSIDGGGLVTRPEPVVVADAVSECLQEVGTDGLVAVRCPADLVANVDPHHLRRILDNYVRNALKYGGAPVTIDATRDPDGVVVRVSDQGPGVPPEFEARLFGKFARADTPETRNQPGTGLGLSIVRGLAEANGGQASYAPNLPRGSSFSIRLPAAGNGPGRPGPRS